MLHAKCEAGETTETTHLSVLVIRYRDDCVRGDTFHAVDAAGRGNNGEMKFGESVSMCLIQTCRQDWPMGCRQAPTFHAEKMWEPIRLQCRRPFGRSNLLFDVGREKVLAFTTPSRRSCDGADERTSHQHLVRMPLMSELVLTSANDHVFGPAHNAHVTLFVHDANVTGSHPDDVRFIGMPLECFVCSFGVFPVPLHYDVPGGLVSEPGSVSARNGRSQRKKSW